MIKVPDYHLGLSPDGKWIKKPGRLKIAFHTISVTKSTQLAEQLVVNQRLKPHQRKTVVSSIAKFDEAYEKLNQLLHTPKGNIPIAEDSVELRNLWHSYLFKGRELLDVIGGVFHICFDLNQKTTGLNKKKLESIKNIVLQAMRKKQGLDSLIKLIDESKIFISDFIELRNREKANGDTLMEAPMVSETGVPTGGKVREIEITFIQYLDLSYGNILGFVKAVVG